jgi:excisionase family DNA binding protein
LAPPSKPDSYSTAYVATRLGVSVPTVQRWVDAGHLKAWKTPGGHRRIDARSAEALFREGPRIQDSQEASDDTPSLKVVIVDDNADDRELLALWVDTAMPGTQVILADNGFQGLVAIGQVAPDIVITDIMMPRMDGVEMLNQLAQHCAVRPRVLIATSSLNAAQLAQHGPLPDGVHFLAKPMVPGDFFQLLRTALASGAVTPGAA